MEFYFWMLAVWLFIFYVERSIVKADGMPFLAIIFEAFGADLRPRAEAWFLASLFLIHIFFGTHAMLIVFAAMSLQFIIASRIMRSLLLRVR